MSGFSPIARRLADLADDHGVFPHHLPRHPEWLAAIGLEPEDLDRDLIIEATACHEAAVRALVRRHGLAYSC